MIFSLDVQTTQQQLGDDKENDMPAACRVGDNALCPKDSHGKKCCSHKVSGPAVSGSSDVSINGRAALRTGDPGKHSGCCGSKTWKAASGSSTVLVNGIPLVRLGDVTQHCGGKGKMIEASSDVIID
jgi:uncharacterized Zn-binding protein involved in type VI secretion